MKTSKNNSEQLIQKLEMYINEADAIALTGYSRTSLYNFRTAGVLAWTASVTGRKLLYHKGDLLKLMGL